MAEEDCLMVCSDRGGEVLKLMLSEEGPDIELDREKVGEDAEFGKFGEVGDLEDRLDGRLDVDEDEKEEDDEEVGDKGEEEEDKGKEEDPDDPRTLKLIWDIFVRDVRSGGLILV